MTLVRRAFRQLAIIILGMQLLACGGGGGDTGPTNPPPDVPDPQSTSGEAENTGETTTGGGEAEQSSSNVTISGLLTYDRVPFSASFYAGLDYDEIENLPMRGVSIYALDASGQIVDSTVASEFGDYQLTVPENTDVKIRVAAKLYSANPSWNVSVKDNTQNGMEYVLEGSLASSGTDEQVRNLHAASGWSNGAYTESRSSAPFAILDSMYDSIQTLVEADANIDLPALTVYWSENNIAVGGSYGEGMIGSSLYSTGEGAIYILGKADNDSDEFDRAVIQHEFGHYVEDKVSRSESIGGSHNLDTQLDMRVAFGEAWGNAFAAMSSGDTVYRDSFGGGQKFGFSFDVESNTVYKPGWFSERSLQSIIYDIFDSNADGGIDNVSLGITAIYNALKHPDYLAFDGTTSIYPFVDIIKSQNPNAESDIDVLLAAHQIYGSGKYGEGETNDGGASHTLPIYNTVQVGQTVNVCSGNETKEYNGADVNRFVRVDIAQLGSYTIEAVKTGGTVATTNPQFQLYKNGDWVSSSRSSTRNRETLTRTFQQGTYLLQVYEEANSDSLNYTGGLACFDVSLN